MEAAVRVKKRSNSLAYFRITNTISPMNFAINAYGWRSYFCLE
jgi:hypothetical protein